MDPLRSPITSSIGDTSGPLAVAIGDFNNGKKLDGTIAIWGVNQMSVFLGYGDGTFTNVTNYSTGDRSGLSSINVDDLNKDSYPDIFVDNEVTYNIRVLYGNGDGTFRNIVLYSLGSDVMPTAIVIADFNNDTKLDVIFTDNVQGIGVLLGNGVKLFGSYTSLLYINGSSLSSIALGDFNKDTSLDIAITNSGTDSVGVLLGHGNESFENIMIYSTGNSSEPSSIVLDDFNRDTLLDIAVVNSNTNNIGIFLRSNNETFADEILYPVGYDCRPNSVALGDFNNDSWIDIAVANYVASNIKILLNCSLV